MINKYILDLNNIDDKCKFFILRQINRMPDHYRLGIKIICSLFYIFGLEPKNSRLLDKLLSSLTLIKLYE